jgi:hypothetical protein
MPFVNRFRNEKGQAHDFAKAMRTEIIWTFFILGAVWSGGIYEGAPFPQLLCPP